MIVTSYLLRNEELIAGTQRGHSDPLLLTQHGSGHGQVGQEEELPTCKQTKREHDFNIQYEYMFTYFIISHVGL